MASQIIIKDGTVYDPVNKVNSEVKDILIKDGRIVEKLQGKTKTINAKNKIVMLHRRITLFWRKRIARFAVTYDLISCYWYF